MRPEDFFSRPSLSPIWGRYIWARVREQTVRFSAGPEGITRERPTLDRDLIGGGYSIQPRSTEVATPVAVEIPLILMSVLAGIFVGTNRSVLTVEFCMTMSVYA